MSTATNDMKKEIQRDVDRLRTLRDELRVKLHLASMDAKTEWTKLEPKIAEAEHAAEKASKESYDIVANAVKKLNKLLAGIA
jgi:hypothetical protein